MNIKGIGTDIVSKDRIKEANIEERYLTDIEKEILATINDEGRIDFISGRWAAKESVVKASNKEIVFSSVSVIKSETGKPVVLIDGVQRDDIHISISHEKEYTLAFCIIERV